MAQRRKVSAGVAAGNTCMWAKQPCRAAAAGSMLLDADLLSPAKVKFGHKLRFLRDFWPKKLSSIRGIGSFWPIGVNDDSFLPSVSVAPVE